MKKQLYKSFPKFFILTSVLLSACATPPEDPIVVPVRSLVVECDFGPLKRSMQIPAPALLPEMSGTMTPIPLNAVQMVDQWIAEKVLVQSVMARSTATGTLEVIARLINCTDYPLQVEGRSSFLDSNQFPTEKFSAWRRVFLQPRATAIYQEKSVSTNISYYLIELREGN